MPPVYQTARGSAEIEALRELIEGLKANDGWLYQALVRKWGKSKDPRYSELLELMVHHPDLKHLLQSR
jgi:hypothetical protein